MTSITHYTTFGVPAYAQSIIPIDNESAITPACFAQPFLVMGGGSNFLFVHPFAGNVILMRIKGRRVEHFADCVHVHVAAGESWHETVQWAVEQGYGGIENLALIPGTVGAAPVQNIGAYGVELQEVLVSVRAYHIPTGQWQVLERADCRLGYRDSVFKRQQGVYLITSVTLRLTKHHHHYATHYGPLQHLERPDLRSIFEEVVAIRQQKLPDPAKIGNAGSFFKNPIIAQVTYQALLKRYPTMPHFSTPGEGKVKVPAAFLIEQAGFKGYTVDERYGVSPVQPLVLVHYRDATGPEIWGLAQRVIQAVKEQFGILLEPEVNVVL